MKSKVLFTPDRLTLLIKFKDYKSLNKLIFNTIDVYLKIQSNNDMPYYKIHEIYYENIPIGSLCSGFEKNKSISHISIYNYVFYKYQPQLKSFLNQITSLNISVEVSKLEVACDFNGVGQVNKIKKAINNKTIKLKPKYIVGGWNVMWENDDINYDESTLYICQKKNRTVNYLRLENKTNELISSKKNYITEYHYNKGLDTAKDVYRFELIIPQICNFNISDNVEYKSRYTDKRMTKYKIDKLKKEIKEIEDKFMNTSDLVFDDGYQKRCEIVNEYSILINYKSRYDIELNKLFDQSYLKSVFNLFGGDILQSAKSHFLKSIYKRKPKLKMRKMDMNTTVKKTPKFTESDEFIMIKYLAFELGEKLGKNVDYADAREYLAYMINSFVDRKVSRDLFDLV